MFKKSSLTSEVLYVQVFNGTYKKNLMKLSNFVMVMFLHDTMVQPKESEVTCFVIGCVWYATNIASIKKKVYWTLLHFLLPLVKSYKNTLQDWDKIWIMNIICISKISVTGTAPLMCY